MPCLRTVMREREIERERGRERERERETERETEKCHVDVLFTVEIIQGGGHIFGRVYV